MKKHSLTLRIFLMTAALLIAACAVTYGMIAYLTPITYTSIIAEELDQKSIALTKRLEQVTPSESKGILDDFVRDTAAELTVWDDLGNVIYESSAVSIGAAQASEGSGVSASVEEEVTPVPNLGVIASTDDAVPSVIDGITITSEGPTTVDENTTVIESYAPGNMYTFLFSNGVNAEMHVTGGVRAVNQAAEALGRVLPFLIGVVLLISLAGSFFYARYITQPIVSISRIARSIAALDFKARWQRKRGDEIGTLGESLNLLSDNLSDALSRLQEANQALQWDIEREREMERQRLAFFSAVSHELKTPITILKGQLSGMLAQVGIYRDREKYLARSLDVTGRMEGLVKEILTISRIESGSFSLQAKDVDLAILVRKQLELDHELIERKNLALQVHIEQGAVVQGDEALLTKVLDNVLMNAILYSPSGESIRVEVENRTFRVENTGISIPQEMLPQLFMPFSRVEQSRSRKSGGSGLGLYLVKTILDRHDASCLIENTVQGVRFTAYFKKV